MSDDSAKETLRQQYQRRASVNNEQCEFMDCPECGALLAVFTTAVPPMPPADLESTSGD